VKNYTCKCGTQTYHAILRMGGKELQVMILYKGKFVDATSIDANYFLEIETAPERPNFPAARPPIQRR
jgi:hypothetical protein